MYFNKFGFILIGAFIPIFSMSMSGCNSSDPVAALTHSWHHHHPTELLVMDQGNNRVVSTEDDLQGHHFDTYSLPSGGVPGAVAVDSSHRKYITDSLNSLVLRIDHLNGENEVSFGSAGSANDQFSQPAGIALDSENRIYVADTGNNRIVRMDDMIGTNWTSFGSLGSGSDQFSGPTALVLDPSGRIYVADSGNNRIVRMDDMTGTNWTTLSAAHSGVSGPTSFSNPTAIALGISRDEQGSPSVSNILIADTDNDRIVLVDDLLGTSWTSFGSSGAGTNEFDSPSGVAFGPHGRILVTDSGNSRLVSMQDMTGTGWTALGELGPGDSQFSNPGSLFQY